MEDLYRQALKAAEEELDELMTEQAQLEARINRLRETIMSLAYLLGADELIDGSETVEQGLTSAISKVLRVSGAALTPAQIRDELARMGFNIKRYSDIIPSITKVLQRLHKKGRVDVGTMPGVGRKVYIWSPIQPSSSSRVMDVFSGRGNAPVMGRSILTKIAEEEGTDIVITNPPYSAARKGKGKYQDIVRPAKENKITEQLAQKAASKKSKK